MVTHCPKFEACTIPKDKVIKIFLLQKFEPSCLDTNIKRFEQNVSYES